MGGMALPTVPVPSCPQPATCQARMPGRQQQAGLKIESSGHTQPEQSPHEQQQGATETP